MTSILENQLCRKYTKTGLNATYIFISFRPKEDGTYSIFNDIKNACRSELKRLGLDDLGYCCHDLRRPFASILYAKGVPLLTISRLLGLRSVKTSERYLNVKL